MFVKGERVVCVRGGKTITAVRFRSYVKWKWVNDM